MKQERIFVSELSDKELTDDIIDRVLFDGLEDIGGEADCIIVLGSIKASLYRIPVAVDAYRMGRAPKMILCGGSIRDFQDGRMSEAEHMCIAAEKLGVMKEDIILDEISKNTVENLLQALFLLQRYFWLNRVRRVLLVTASYHMRRSLHIAKYLFPGHIEVLPCPVGDDNTKKDNWMNTDLGRERATTEVRKIIKFVKNGVFPDFEI